MKLITFCIRYPVSVIVGIILALLFGVISLTRIPLQMTPPSTAPRSRSKPPIDLPPKKWKMRSSTARRKS